MLLLNYEYCYRAITRYGFRQTTAARDSTGSYIVGVGRRYVPSDVCVVVSSKMFFWLSNPRFSSRFQVIKIGLWSLPPPLNTLSCTLQLPLFAFLFPAFCKTRNILQAIRAVSNSHVKIRIITLILVVYRSSKHDKAWSKWTFDDEAVVKQALHSNPLSLIHIWRCRRSTLCRSRWSPYH